MKRAKYNGGDFVCMFQCPEEIWSSCATPTQQVKTHCDWLNSNYAGGTLIHQYAVTLDTPVNDIFHGRSRYGESYLGFRAPWSPSVTLNFWFFKGYNVTRFCGWKLNQNGASWRALGPWRPLGIQSLKFPGCLVWSFWPIYGYSPYEICCRKYRPHAQKAVYRVIYRSRAA